MRNPARGGASVSPGSDNESSTPNPRASQPALTPIDVFAPWAGEAERALRLRLHKARDVAQARAARSKYATARSLYWIAAQTASGWVFARAPNDELEDILKALSWLFLAVGILERREAPDAD